MTLHRLYYSPAACSMAVHIVLEEIGVQYETELVSSRGQHEGAGTSSETWRRINPKRRIPALSGVQGTIGGSDGLLTEATAILVYLARTYPKARLLPATSAEEARCLEWMNWLASNVHAMSYGQIWRAARYSVNSAGFADIEAKGRQNLLEQYAFIESILSDGRAWAVPGGYSIVDPYLLVFYHWGQRIGLEMRRDYPAWSALIDKLLLRPAVSLVLEKEQVSIK